MFTKKVLVFLVIGLFILIGTDLYAEQPIRLLVNGNEIFSDPQPTIINDRVMVPLRWISEALDAEVIWDETSRTVAVTSKPEPHFVRINGQLTTWPYWIKDGLVYMEYRNAIQLVREDISILNIRWYISLVMVPYMLIRVKFLWLCIKRGSTISLT